MVSIQMELKNVLKPLNVDKLHQKIISSLILYMITDFQVTLAIEVRHFAKNK